MKTTCAVGIAIALGFVAGCGHGSMHEGVDAMKGAMGDVRAENARHHDAVLSMTALPDALVELGQHERVMDGLMPGMDSAMDMMSHCAGPGTRAMSDLMAGMRSATTTHRAAMAAAADLRAAQSECSSHTGTMIEMMDEMDRVLPSAGCM